MSSIKIYMNGKLVDQQDAKVSVFDHGFLYGDGVFEGIRVYNGKIFREREHIDRLWDSCKTVDIKMPMTKEEVAAAKEEPLTLKESLALAKESKKASDVINKKYVADFLISTFGEDVECNMRENYTKTNLPLADTHYAIGEDGKKCFVYVYETDAVVVLLMRLNEEYAESVRTSGHKIVRSAFPKSKDAWYTVIADASYTEDDIQELLTDGFNLAKYS